MRLFIKTALMTLLCLVVVFAILADLPMARRFQPLLGLGLYLKLISLLGLVIVTLLAWGYKRQVEASQKYRRADEVLAQAEAAFERKRHACEQMQVRLEDAFAKKEQGLNDQLEQLKQEYQQRLNGLKEQNLELKETVAKLMNSLKRGKLEHS